MVKVRVKIPIFNDLKEGKQRKFGDVYETTEERARELVEFSYGNSTIQIVEIIEVIPEEKEEIEVVKKMEKPTLSNTKKTRKKIDKKEK